MNVLKKLLIPVLSFFPLFIAYRGDFFKYGSIDFAFVSFTCMTLFVFWFSYRNGVWPYCSIAFSAFFLHAIVRRGDWVDYYSATFCVGSYWILDFIFLDRGKFNKPVYLTFTKKSMFCESFLDRFTHVKHSMILVHYRGERYFVFHAKGKILEKLTPSKELKRITWLRRHCVSFYKVGLTSREIMKSFMRTNYKITMTCQLYCHMSACYLCRPFGSSALTTKLVGRFSFYMFIIVLMGLWSLNHFSAQLPLLSIQPGILPGIDFFFIYYANLDFLKDKYPHTTTFEAADIRRCLFGCLYYFLMWFFRPFEACSGYERVMLFIIFSVGAMWLVRLTIPVFGANTNVLFDQQEERRNKWKRKEGGKYLESTRKVQKGEMKRRGKVLGKYKKVTLEIDE